MRKYLKSKYFFPFLKMSYFTLFPKFDREEPHENHQNLYRKYRKNQKFSSLHSRLLQSQNNSSPLESTSVNPSTLTNVSHSFKNFNPIFALKAISLFKSLTNQNIPSKESIQNKCERLKELIFSFFSSNSDSLKENAKNVMNLQNHEIFNIMEAFSQENFFPTSRDFKYITLMIFKKKISFSYDIYALDLITMTLVGLYFSEASQKKPDIHEIVLKYMRELKKECSEAIFIIQSELFEKANINAEILKKKMNEYGLVFIEFYKKAQPNDEILQEEYTTVSTRHKILPRILSNSEEEINNFIKERNEKERFFGAKKVAKRICFLRSHMKRVNKSYKNHRVFSLIALGLYNIFALARNISKKKNFKEFLYTAKKRIGESFQISKLI